MNFKTTVLGITMSTFVISCSNTSPNDLVDTTPISANVSFSQDVKSIMDGNCVQCHGTVPTNGAPMSLTTYDNVKDAVLNRGLIDRINLNLGNGLLMPQGGPKLPANKIATIQKWKDQNFNQ